VLNFTCGKFDLRAIVETNFKRTVFARGVIFQFFNKTIFKTIYQRFGFQRLKEKWEK